MEVSSACSRQKAYLAARTARDSASCTANEYPPVSRRRQTRFGVSSMCCGLSRERRLSAARPPHGRGHASARLGAQACRPQCRAPGGRRSPLGRLRLSGRHDRAKGIGPRDRAALQRHRKPLVAGGPLFTTGHESFPEIPTSCSERPRTSCPADCDLEAGARSASIAPPDTPAGPHAIPRYDSSGWQLRDDGAQFSRAAPTIASFAHHRDERPVPRTKAPRSSSPNWSAAPPWLEDTVFVVDDTS